MLQQNYFVYINVTLLYPSLKDKLRKAQCERDQLEYQLKTEKDEKELYKVIYSFHFFYLPIVVQENYSKTNLVVGNWEQLS